MIRSLAAAAALATLVVAGAAAPASADDEIGLSRDGVSWSRQLDAPLFDDAFLWVPGDIEQESFIVRNDGPSAGELAVDVVSEDPDGLLASDAFLLEARVGTGEWVEIAAGTTAVTPTVLDVPEGARTRITVRGTFRPETTDHMDEIAPFRVRVTLSEDGDVGGETEGNGGGEVGGQDALPDTGSPLGSGVIWFAAALIGAGIALVRPGRESRREVARGQA